MTSLCHADYRSCRRCGNSLSLHRHDPRLPPAARPPNRGSSGPAGHDEGRRLPKKVCLFAENIKSCTGGRDQARSEEHTSELQSLMPISYAAFCLKKKHNTNTTPSVPLRDMNKAKYTMH